ncbi:MAG TPA: glycoside hydrolase family 43 protein [Acidimicrobiales bacterium]|nr:glycoside hydrolase family 43 protein [Acidimicrobiales bacterium]
MTDRVVVLEEPRDPEPGASRPRLRRRRTALVVTVVAVVALVAVALVATRHGAETTTAMPRLPVFGPAHDVYDGDLGDPFVLPVRTGGTVASFVAFGTGDWPARIPTAHSADGVTWQQGGDALPALPAWAGSDPKNSLSWAPSAVQIGQAYVLYVTLPDAASGQQCIAAATSTTPEGPYTGAGNGPLLCQHELGGSIDPTTVVDRAGHLHMLWKNDGNSVGAPSGLWEQQLTADGLGLVGTAHRLLGSDQAWQGGIVEEPALIPATGGGFWLFYSGNFFDKPEYATGLAFCPTLEGPCRDAQDGPFLATPALQQQNQFAPGGLETFRDAKGALLAVFDTWNRPTRNGRFYCCRSLQVAQIISA